MPAPHRLPLILGVLAAATLAACTDPPERREKVLVEKASAPTIDTTIISLAPLTEGDLTQHPVAGELGCSFTNPQKELVLLAKGDVGSKTPAEAVIKTAGGITQLSAPGGFDALSQGATFTGQDKTLRVALTGPAVGGGESPPRPAKLTYERPGNGASQTFEGLWTCGP